MIIVCQCGDGPFKGFDGAVSDIDTQKGKIRAMVSMFGRDTPVELDALQMNKVWYTVFFGTNTLDGRVKGVFLPLLSFYGIVLVVGHFLRR